MRQRLRGTGKYEMSSSVRGTNRQYVGYFPANVNEEDLDAYLEIAREMREEVNDGNGRGGVKDETAGSDFVLRVYSILETR